MPRTPQTDRRLREHLARYVAGVAEGAANVNDALNDHHQGIRTGHAVNIALALGPYCHEPIEVPEACGDVMVMAEYDHPQAIIHRGSIILLDDPDNGFRLVDDRLVLNLDIDVPPEGVPTPPHHPVLSDHPDVMGPARLDDEASHSSQSAAVAPPRCRLFYGRPCVLVAEVEGEQGEDEDRRKHFTCRNGHEARVRALLRGPGHYSVISRGTASLVEEFDVNHEDFETAMMALEALFGETIEFRKQPVPPKGRNPGCLENRV